jgi:WD40 repeat protein
MVSGDGGKVIYWELKSPFNCRSIGIHDGIIRSVSISSNERFVISGSLDGSVGYWDLEDSSNHFLIGDYDHYVNSL